MGKIVYPSDDKSKSKARVVFRSYNWKMNTPKLANTVEKVYGGFQTEIQLYLPAEFSEHYRAEWGAEDLATVLLDTSNKGARATFWEGANAATKKVGLEGIVNTAVKYNNGYTHYPGEFSMFKKGTPMSLTFTFDMLPRTSGDSVAIENIVDTFKRQMLPMFTGGVLQFPNIWQIAFNGILGPGHPQTANMYNDMALVDVIPSYSGGNQSALVMGDSYPVGVKLQLTFQAIKHNYLFST